MSTLVFDVAEEARRLTRPGSVPGSVCALGIDPGPVPGIFLARWVPGVKKAVMARAFQCNADAAPGLLAMILNVYAEDITCGQVEEFRPGRGPGGRGKPAAVTTRMGTELLNLAAERGVKLAVRHSSRAFPWASDKKLEDAGILAATAQLPHARAASRHALWCAVHDGGLPDPSSRRTA